MRPRRRFAVVLASALALSACSLASEPEAVAPTRPPSVADSAVPSSASAAPSGTASADGAQPSDSVSAAATTADLSRFYDQKVTWKNCGDADCTTFEVPLDYSDPTGPTVELAASRVSASGDKIGTLFVDPGGPGGSAFDYAKSAGSIVSPSVLAHFDVVGVDPRGVGNSEPVDCLTDSQIDSLIAVDGTPDSPAEEAAIVDESTLPGKGCAAKSGAVWAHMGTVDAARDLDIARAIVKDETFSYLGKSYGTMLGATYAELFPDRVGRMVLDGVLPTSLDLIEVTKGQADAFEVAVRDFAKDCLTHSDCPLSGTPEQGVGQLQTWLTGLDARPIPAGDRDLSEPLATYAVLSFLYFPAYDYPRLRSALASAMDKKDPQPLLMLLDERTSRGPDGRFTDNSTEAFYGVTCLDRPFDGTVDDVKALAKEWAATAPTFGPSLAWGLLTCKDWPARTDVLTDATARGSNPILVVSTTHDPATPYQWGERVAAELDNARLLTWDGYNHTAYREGSACIEGAVNAYLLKGTLPKEGTVCS
jgi:pimeloyl-ACP methyl ester carboxylesterase